MSDLSEKAQKALPRIRMHIAAAKASSEWNALFDRTGKKPCGFLRHKWLYYGLFGSHKVCRKCGLAK